MSRDFSRSGGRRYWVDRQIITQENLDRMMAEERQKEQDATPVIDSISEQPDPPGPIASDLDSAEERKTDL